MTNDGTARVDVAPLRVGVVDVGSNAIRFAVAEWVAPGQPPRILESSRAPISFGRDVFLTGTIAEATLSAAVEVFTTFRATCERVGVTTIRAVGTAALRDARNQADAARRITDASGISIHVVSGSEEAYLLSVAVRSRIDLAQGRSLLVDLGGGSVEVSLIEHGEVAAADSFPLGALRVLRALTDDEGTPLGDGFFDLLDDYVASVADRIDEHFGGAEVDRYVATGGNIESIADLLARDDRTVTRGGVESCRLSAVKTLARELAQLSHAERMARFDLRADRADTILPAAVVYYRIGRRAGVNRLLVPRVGLRDGLLATTIADCRREPRTRERRDALLAACRALGRRYHTDPDHAETVRRLAVVMFDQTQSLHGLLAEHRLFLEAAALLHDIGSYVGNARHHKHSAYLILASDIVGLDDESRRLVAHIARYHRRAHPSDKHDGWSALGSERQGVVARLAAILRVADGLDRARRSKVDELTVEIGDKDARLRVTTRDDDDADLRLEQLGLREKATLFEAVFGRRVKLEATRREPESP